MDERKELEKKIIDEAERMGPADEFRFSCRPGVSCFTNCCADVNIILTPYDIVRLKNRLGLDSGSFLRTHTLSPFMREQVFPVIALKMREDEHKTCPFLGTAEQGCTVYEDRPWSCRMYPVGKASPSSEKGRNASEFFFLMREGHCKGFEEATQGWTIKGWMDDQGVADYDRHGEEFKDIVLHKLAQQGVELGPHKMEMFQQAFYDIDRFRAFVFESSFLDKVDVSDEEQERLRSDDSALLTFASKWLRFGLFGDTSAVKIKEHILEAKREDLRRTGKLK